MGAEAIMHHSYCAQSAVWESPHLGLMIFLGSEWYRFQFTDEEAEVCRG